MAHSQNIVQKLSATKQRLSLGEVKKAEKAKKQQQKGGSTRKVTRTTVVNSVDFEWPDINEGDENAVIECLKSVLKCLRLPDESIPLNEIRKVKAEERSKFRRRWLTQKHLEIGFNFTEYKMMRDNIVLGVNQVSRGLEQNTVTGVIIEKDVDPALITKALIPLARTRNIPLIAIKRLRTTCKETFNTNVVAFGLKNNCKESLHSFNPIFKLVESLCAWKTQTAPISDTDAGKVETTESGVSLETEIPDDSAHAQSEVKHRGSKRTNKSNFNSLKLRRV